MGKRKSGAVIAVSIVCMLASGSVAFGQSSGPVPEVGQPVTETRVAKETIYTFGDDNVIGGFKKPGDILVTSRTEEKLNSLIEVRTNFVNEMLVSAEEL